MRKSLILFFVFLNYNLFAQQLYPELSGQALIDQLRIDYKPAVVMGYDTARDTMYAVIDNIDGYVTGVYTGYTIYLDPTADPSTDAYSKDINAEHTWPQSMGAETGNARSDMHHLYPARVQVNSSRGNDPFADIDDNQTDTWWRNDYSQSSIPTSNIDEYSEKDNTGYFEPRESHKGNVARSMFYFYTMYKEQSDTNFFNQQKETLYEWHLADPADARELERSQLVAHYQSNKENPFVLDSSLVRRAFLLSSSGGSGGDTTVTGASGDVIITEIMQNPSAVYDSDGEWFEIYNTTSEDIDINGWYLRDSDNDEHQISNGASLIISSESYLILSRNSNYLTNGGVSVDYQYSGMDLANGDDELIIFASDGTTEIDRVEYDGGPNWPDPSGASMVFEGSVSDANNDYSFWSVSQLPWSGSAGDLGTPGYGDMVSEINLSTSNLPEQFSLTCYPNPFNPQTTVEYHLAQAGNVYLAVYNQLGQRVKILVNEHKQSGKYKTPFLGQDLSSGVYFVMLQTQNQKISQKVILLK